MHQIFVSQYLAPSHLLQLFYYSCQTRLDYSRVCTWKICQSLVLKPITLHSKGEVGIREIGGEAVAALQLLLQQLLQSKHQVVYSTIRSFCRQLLLHVLLKASNRASLWTAYVAIRLTIIFIMLSS